jgi:two-component system chemotaxis response regulator CheY
MVSSSYDEMTVLVVDDQDFMRDIITVTLRQIGFRHIVTASDGRAAIKKVMQATPDLILCDINMEPMNGIEFVTLIQAAGAIGANRIPTIFLTGHADEAKVKAAIKLGIDGFVVKPAKAGPLGRKIKAVLKRYGRSA